MEIFTEVFGEKDNLRTMEMTLRAIAVFFLALLLIRISGRRSFGLCTPIDNIITISLGAILSRVIVGASPAVPVMIACFTIVILHRLIGWCIIHSKGFRQLIEGNKILVYENGNFISKNMFRALVHEGDVTRALRKSLFTDDFSRIDKAYMERNGEITFILKNKD